VNTDRVTIAALVSLSGWRGRTALEFSAVVTIDGAQGVVITGLSVQHGRGEGILGIQGSAFTLRDVTVEQNGSTGKPALTWASPGCIPGCRFTTNSAGSFAPD
jgi:hypothetical protein